MTVSFFVYSISDDGHCKNKSTDVTYGHMITVVQRGIYRLIETKAQTKILILDEKNTYAWINAEEIGEILVTSHKSHIADCILATGNYRLYKVKDESKLTDQMHLELYVGCSMWQGYLLPSGLPTEIKKRNRIIPTSEIISTFNEAAYLQACECD